MDEKQPVRCETLEQIELAMPKLKKLLADRPDAWVGARVILPLVEGMETLAREVRALRQSRPA